MNREVEELAEKIPPRPWLCVVCKQDKKAELFLCLECFQVACNVHRSHDDHDFRVTTASAPCGCKAQEGDWINEPRIAFCPKHAAADNMLAAFDKILLEIHRYEGRTRTTAATLSYINGIAEAAIKGAQS